MSITFYVPMFLLFVATWPVWVIVILSIWKELKLFKRRWTYIGAKKRVRNIRLFGYYYQIVQWKYKGKYTTIYTYYEKQR